MTPDKDEDDDDWPAAFDAVTGAPSSDFPDELRTMLDDDCSVSFLQFETVDGKTNFYDPFERMEVYADATVPGWRKDGKCLIDALAGDWDWRAELDAVEKISSHVDEDDVDIEFVDFEPLIDAFGLCARDALRLVESAYCALYHGEHNLASDALDWGWARDETSTIFWAFDLLSRHVASDVRDCGCLMAVDAVSDGFYKDVVCFINRVTAPVALVGESTCSTASRVWPRLGKGEQFAWDHTETRVSDSLLNNNCASYLRPVAGYTAIDEVDRIRWSKIQPIAALFGSGDDVAATYVFSTSDDTERNLVFEWLVECFGPYRARVVLGERFHDSNGHITASYSRGPLTIGLLDAVDTRWMVRTDAIFPLGFDTYAVNFNHRGDDDATRRRDELELRTFVAKRRRILRRWRIVRESVATRPIVFLLQSLAAQRRARPDGAVARIMMHADLGNIDEEARARRELRAELFEAQVRRILCKRKFDELLQHVDAREAELLE